MRTSPKDLLHLRQLMISGSISSLSLAELGRIKVLLNMLKIDINTTEEVTENLLHPRDTDQVECEEVNENNCPDFQVMAFPDKTGASKGKSKFREDKNDETVHKSHNIPHRPCVPRYKQIRSETHVRKDQDAAPQRSVKILSSHSEIKTMQKAPSVQQPRQKVSRREREASPLQLGKTSTRPQYLMSKKPRTVTETRQKPEAFSLVIQTPSSRTIYEGGTAPTNESSYKKKLDQNLNFQEIINAPTYHDHPYTISNISDPTDSNLIKEGPCDSPGDGEPPEDGGGLDYSCFKCGRKSQFYGAHKAHVLTHFYAKFVTNLPFSQHYQCSKCNFKTSSKWSHARHLFITHEVCSRHRTICLFVVQEIFRYCTKEQLQLKEQTLDDAASSSLVCAPKIKRKSKMTSASRTIETSKRGCQPQTCPDCGKICGSIGGLGVHRWDISLT